MKISRNASAFVLYKFTERGTSKLVERACPILIGLADLEICVLYVVLYVVAIIYRYIYIEGIFGFHTSILNLLVQSLFCVIRVNEHCARMHWAVSPSMDR